MVEVEYQALRSSHPIDTGLFCLWLVNLMSIDIMKNTFVSLCFILVWGTAFQALLAAVLVYSFLISGAVMWVENKAISHSQESLQGPEAPISEESSYCLSFLFLSQQYLDLQVARSFLLVNSLQANSVQVGLKVRGLVISERRLVKKNLWNYFQPILLL